MTILKNAKHCFEKIINEENVDYSDVTEIRFLRNYVREVFEEYRTRLNRKVEEVSQYQPKSLFVEMESQLNPQPVKNLVRNSINERREPQEILILPNSESGEQKVYIPVEE